jgi:adenylosuccinate synthase
VLYPHITSVIGNGVVVNPSTLIDELDMLTRAGSTSSRVRVSRSAHVIMPYHVALDRRNEARCGAARSARPGAGSGRPTATAHGGSGCAWRTCSTRRPARAHRRVVPDKNLLLAGWAADLRGRGARRRGAGWGERLREHLDDTTWLVQAALGRGEHVLLEGRRARCSTSTTGATRS